MDTSGTDYLRTVTLQPLGSDIMPKSNNLNNQNNTKKKFVDLELKKDSDKKSFFQKIVDLF